MFINSIADQLQNSPKKWLDHMQMKENIQKGTKQNAQQNVY